MVFIATWLWKESGCRQKCDVGRIWRSISRLLLGHYLPRGRHTLDLTERQRHYTCQCRRPQESCVTCFTRWHFWCKVTWCNGRHCDGFVVGVFEVIMRARTRTLSPAPEVWKPLSHSRRLLWNTKITFIRNHPHYFWPFFNVPGMNQVAVMRLSFELNANNRLTIKYP